MSGSKLPNLGVRIKTEPGMESERLSSFKLPKDLTLGGQAHKAKRVFAPNVNVARNRNKPEPTTSRYSSSPRTRGGRGRGSRGTDRGRGRGREEFIQSQGVFSEGIAENKRKSGMGLHSSSGSEGKTREADVIEKPKLDLKQEIKVDKEEEDKKLEDLFIQKRDYGHLEPDNENGPISLPYREYKKEFKIKIKVEKDQEMPSNFQKSSHKVHGLSKILKNSDLPVISNLPDLLQTEKHRLIFFQFPDSLPAFGNSPEPTTPLVKDKKPQSTETTPPVANKCSFQDLEEGLAGKIVIYRSGRAKLFFGSTEFSIELEMHRSFLQDVVAIDAGVDKPDSSTINLGSIDGGVVVTPDWNYVLNNIP